MNLPKSLHNLPNPPGNNKKFYPYKPAKLNHKDHDTSKEWYIEFWAWDKDLNRLRRKRLTKINQIKSVEQRMAYASQQIELINQALKAGYFFHDSERQIQQFRRASEQKTYPLFQGLELILEMQRGHLKDKYSLSLSNYQTTARAFTRWMQKNDYHRLMLPAISREMTSGYVNHLIDKGNKAKSINTVIMTMQSLFNKMIDQGWTTENPWKGLKLKGATTTDERFYPYNQMQIAEIKTFMLERDKQMWQVIQLIFFCYIRPNEIRQLKIKDITENKIFISGSASKNKTGTHVSMPRPVREMFNTMQLFRYDPEYYVFSYQKKPGHRMLYYNTLNNRYRYHMNVIGYPRQYSLYSWKHTGVIHAYHQGVGIKSIQLQLRHGSILTTDVYLRALGLMDNREFTDKMDQGL
jgi:site-specific recombinase XerD